MNIVTCLSALICLYSFGLIVTRIRQEKNCLVVLYHCVVGGVSRSKKFLLLGFLFSQMQNTLSQNLLAFCPEMQIIQY